MAEFTQSISFVLENEGGLVNNPNDPGGVTNYGISQRSYPNLTIPTLTRENAIEIYKRDYWKFDDVQDQTIATKLFDLSVNMGFGTAIRLLQRSLNIPQDGLLGPNTLRLMNAANPDNLLFELKARQAEFYARMVLKDPSKITFLLGWLRRAVKP